MSATGYLTLSEKGRFCVRTSSPASCVKWVRGHILPNIPHYSLPGSGVLFCCSYIDAWISKHRQDPRDLYPIVREVLGILRNQAKERNERFTATEGKEQ